MHGRTLAKGGTRLQLGEGRGESERGERTDPKIEQEMKLSSRDDELCI